MSTLKLAEKDKLLADMREPVEELRRKGEQEPQQLQGEAQELELQAMLKSAFPGDLIRPVPKGRNGGDVIHQVAGPNGLQSGTILWESKRTRSWSDSWLAKSREDQRLASANVAAIVTAVLSQDRRFYDETDITSAMLWTLRVDSVSRLGNNDIIIPANVAPAGNFYQPR